MSGGSFDYLYLRSADELPQHMVSLKAMATMLKEECPESKAGQDTRMIADNLDLAFNAINKILLSGLSDVWHVAEWYKSNDSSKEELEKAVRKYDGGKP